MVDFFTASVATGYELVYLDKVDIAESPLPASNMKQGTQ